MSLIITLPPYLRADDSSDTVLAADLLKAHGLQVVGSWDDWSDALVFPQSWSGPCCAAVFPGALDAQLRYRYKFRSNSSFYVNPDANCCASGDGGMYNWDVLCDSPALVVLPVPDSASADATIAIAGSFNAWQPWTVSGRAVSLHLSQGS